MLINDPEQVMPAGSMPPETATAPEQGQAPSDPQQENTTTQPDTEAKEPEKILGKFVNSEELAKAYVNLEQAHGRHSQEVGELRKQNNMLMENLNKLSMAVAQPQQQQAQQAPDYNAQITQIQKQVESGELSFGDALRLTHDLTAQAVSQQVSSLADQKIQDYDRRNRQQQAYNHFLNQHPDYEQTVASGVLQQIKAQNPLHDDMSAYLEFKVGQEAQTRQTAEQQAYERGKTDAAKLAAGADQTRTILSKPGATARQVNAPVQGPVSEQDRLNFMMEALQKARTTGG